MSYLKWKRQQITKNRQRKAFAKLLPKNAVGVEVGVWKGDHARLLIDQARPKRLFLVDEWRVTDDPEKFGEFNHSNRASQEKLDAIYMNVRNYFDGRATDCRVMRLESTRAAQGFMDRGVQVDWLYLDGDHTFEGVSRDLEAWWPVLKPGGVLHGDDFLEGQWWGRGVIDGVMQHCKRHGVQVEHYPGGQWRIVKPKAVVE